MGPARQRHRRLALLPWPTHQPLPSPSVRPAAHARCTSPAPAGLGPLQAGRRPQVGRDPPPPCSCPASSMRRPGSPTPPPPCLTHPLPKRSRTTPLRLGLFFPPPSPLRTPHGKPHRCPSVPPSERYFPRLNSGRSATAIHPLAEPLTEPFPRQSRPHLTSLSPSPWCRARAPSLVTTVPAPPPSTATVLCRPTAPPPP
jgi:hypothetical protein